MKPEIILFLWLAVFSSLGGRAEEKPSPAPSVDRVGFPKDYAIAYQVLRIVNKTNEQKVVTVYGNKQAASITNLLQLPFPYGSVIVMETASAGKDAQGELLISEDGSLRKDAVTGIHVMRRERGFGEAYGKDRAGEWEFVEYKPDGSYLTPPQKSASCAACHVKAGLNRDFVYRGRLIEPTSK